MSTTFIDIVSTIFFLVPGFLIVKIHQSTREFRDLSAFEYTTLSVAQSFMVFLLWVLWILFIGGLFPFHLIEDLKDLVLNGNHALFFTRSLAVFFTTYLTAFLIAALFLYNFAWTRIVNKGLRLIGFKRFTEHLTPWEEFQMLGRPNWILVELKNGRSIAGKLAFASHIPFGKELVLKRVDQSPVMVYDENHELVDYGPEIDMTYVNGDEIRTMHMVRDGEAEKRMRPAGGYTGTLLSLALSTVLIAFCMMAIALRLDSSCPGWLSWIPYASPLALPAVFWNLKSLSRHG